MLVHDPKNTRNLFVVNKTSCYLKKLIQTVLAQYVHNLSPFVDTLSFET